MIEFFEWIETAILTDWVVSILFTFGFVWAVVWGPIADKKPKSMATKR